MLRSVRLFLFLFVFLSLFSGVLAIDFGVGISNSENWRDVYSTMLYSSLSNADGEFLVSTAHGPLLLNGVSKSADVLVVSSRKDKYVLNYPGMMGERGFTSVDELVVDDANLELIDEMPDVNNFIIVGNDYGYNAVAVVNYAMLTNSWVFLADRANIDDIDVIMSNRNVGDVVVYGYVDREVRDAMQKYNPRVINNNDKFLDNIEIVEAAQKINFNEQVILTNGEFIEKEIMLGKYPVLFTGRENVPDQIRDYIKSSDIKIGVLIGNELVGAATNIKRSAGIDVIAKFARGARSQNTGIAAVEGLDLFYLPSPRLELEIYSIKYNSATSRLEVTYHSNSNVPAYFKGTISVDSDGDTTRVGDMDAIFIAPGDYKTVVYDGVSFNGDNFEADVYTLYGEISTALDRILEGRYNVSIVNVIDSCQLEIKSIVYNKQKEMFYANFKNPSAVDCYVDVELRDVIINEIKTTVGAEEAFLVRSGKSVSIPIKQRMDVEDLKDNDFINVYAYYGQRKESLVNVLKGNLEIVIQTFTLMTWFIIILLIIIILLVILVIIYKRKENDF